MTGNSPDPDVVHLTELANRLRKIIDERFEEESPQRILG